MKLFDPKESIDYKPSNKRNRKRKNLPRCHCGCGRAAVWPRDGQPIFYTRLCGYTMAVKIIRGAKEGSA